MNTPPNPLIPQGSFQRQSRGNPNVRIVVFTIVALHAVFFGGLLIQGCKRDAPTQAGDPEETETNMFGYLPKLDADFYTDPGQLPAPAPRPAPGTSTSDLRDLPPPSSPRTVTPSDRTPAPPEEAAGPPPRDLPRPPVTAQTQEGRPREHVVVRGDNFSTLAARYGVTVGAISRANPGVDPRRLQVNQTLVIPAPVESAPAAADEPAGNVYVVQPGDNLWAIARKHGVTVDQLRAANNLRTDRILVGDKLRLPEQAKAASKNNS